MNTESLLRISPEILTFFPWPPISLDDVCQPKILVVTDMSFEPDEKFSLSEFVKTLETNKVRARFPKVIKANIKSSDPEANIVNFKFNDANHGLEIGRYHVCFIFTFHGANIAAGQSPIPIQEVDAIARFMNAGGGVFATGDHDDLGSQVCQNIPRVRSMRKWTSAQGVPHGANEFRLSTNLAGDDHLFQFRDESDIYPQRIYLNWTIAGGRIGQVHPIVQLSGNRTVNFIPDHPHEGECLIPDNLNTVFSLDSNNVDEWPKETGGNNRVSPEIVAKSMSHGGGFGSTKHAVMPREFITIAAYNGHQAGVGRVVTDATWHHFININIKGRNPPMLEGLMPNGVDTPEMTDIRQHWVNLADWLMPGSKPLCWWIIIALSREFTSYPIREEFELPVKDRPKHFDRMVGKQFKAAFANHMLPYQVQNLFDTALKLAIPDTERRLKLEESECICGENCLKISLSESALGALAITLFELSHDGSLQKLKEPELLVEKMGAAAQQAVRNNIALTRRRMEVEGELIKSFS